MPNVAETEFLKAGTSGYLWNSRLLFHNHPHKANQTSHSQPSCPFLGTAFAGVFVYSLHYCCSCPCHLLPQSRTWVPRGASGRAQTGLNPCVRSRWGIFLSLSATALSHSVKTLILVQRDFIDIGVGAEELLEETHPLFSRIFSSL